MMTMSPRLIVGTRQCYGWRGTAFIAPINRESCDDHAFHCPWGAWPSNAARTTASEPHHIGARAGLTENHQSSGITHPASVASNGDRRNPTPRAFGTPAATFFLKLVRSKNRHTALPPPATLCLHMAATTSSNVTSGCRVVKGQQLFRMFLHRRGAAGARLCSGLGTIAP